MRVLLYVIFWILLCLLKSLNDSFAFPLRKFTVALEHKQL
jgi:hypothetical protein